MVQDLCRGTLSASPGYLISKEPRQVRVNLINQLNNFTDERKDLDQNLPYSKHRDLGYFQNFSEKFKSKSLFLLHLNICSLTEKFDEFYILLKGIDIIPSTESRIKKISFPNNY